MARNRRTSGIWTFEVLGPLTVRRGEALPLTRRSHRRLLSILLLDDGRTVPTDVLIDRFWSSSPPPTAKTALHTHLSALRRLLPCGVIRTEPNGYRLVRDGCGLDADELSALVTQGTSAARAARWTESLRTADAAIRLWRGRPFDELADDHFAIAETRRLDELHARALELRVESLVRLGRAPDALPDLEWAVQQYPLRERFTALLATARQLTGSHAEAIRALHTVERALVELGLEPSPALRELEVQILTHRRPSALDHGLTHRRSA